MARATGFRVRVSLWPMVLFAAAFCVDAAAAKPQRIVSLNLCADQLVLMLAERARIASVTYLARDPDSSYMAAAAEGLRLNHGRAEEILPLDPDLVLAGAFSARSTVGLLRRLGYRVVELDLPQDLAGVTAQVREVAALLGERARGEALLGRMRARLAAARAAWPADATDGPRAVLYLPSGFTAGAGTINDAVLRAAGYRNLAAELGLRGPAALPLERLLLAAPDLLLFSAFGPDAPSQAEALLHHPALRRAMRGTPTVRVPSRLWACPGPMLAEAVGLLAEARP